MTATDGELEETTTVDVSADGEWEPAEWEECGVCEGGCDWDEAGVDGGVDEGWLISVV